MEVALREHIRQRARFRCEYCLLPEAATPFTPFHVEHIIAKQHLIDDSIDNLALACDRCNAFKGPNLSSVDPVTLEIVNLFSPRRDVWDNHYLFQGSVVIGTTPKGRATVQLLQMNAARRLELRESWLASGGQF
ncbi:MAG: HNH endonuclease [Pirellulaceae bacterium]|jgi:hypothetical protein|nr:HNH endonuclease [Pirellulaceae bacterium]